MYTQCPECLTYFQVTPEHLKIAQGNVRCGQCRNVFSALGNLTEQPPASAYQATPGSINRNNDIDEFIEEENAPKTRSSATAKKSKPSVKQSARAKAVNNIKKSSTSAKTQAKPKAKAKAAPAKPKTSPAPAKPVAPKAKPKKASFKQKAVPKVDPNPEPNEGSEGKEENKSRLGHAIAAIKALNKSVPNKLTTLEDGRDSYISKLKNNIKNEVKKRVDPQNKKPAANTVKQKPAKTPNNAAPAAAPPVKPSAVEVNPSTTKVMNDANPPAKQANTNTLHDIDLDQAFEDIDNLDLGNDTIIFETITTDTDIDNKNDIKVKNLSRNQSDIPSANQSQLAAVNPIEGKALTVIPKQLVEDFRGVVAQSQPEKHNPINTFWSVGSIILMLIFLVQTIYFKHNDLAKSPQLRPWIESFCSHLACDLSLPSDIKKLELLGQDIRSHPKEKKALLVSTTIINNAGYIQSYPILEITFSNMNGERVAMRRFLAAEYLPNNTDIEKGMPPNTPIKIELGMLDPGADAVNFEFDFLPAT